MLNISVPACIQMQVIDLELYTVISHGTDRHPACFLATMYMSCLVVTPPLMAGQAANSLELMSSKSCIVCRVHAKLSIVMHRASRLHL